MRQFCRLDSAMTIAEPADDRVRLNVVSLRSRTPPQYITAPAIHCNRNLPPTPPVDGFELVTFPTREMQLGRWLSPIASCRPGKKAAECQGFADARRG